MTAADSVRRSTMALRKALVPAAVVLSLASAAVAEEPAAVAPDGEALYRTYCTPCHGMAGNGKGINVPDMSVQPRDHTDSAEMGARTDADLAKAIRGGGPAVGKSVLMPPWGATFDDREVEALIEHLRKLSNTSSTAMLADVAAPGGRRARDGKDNGRPVPRAASPVVAAAAGPLDVVAPEPPEEVLERYPDGELRRFELTVEERVLEVAPGFEAKVWAFNGQVPAPLIRVREGDHVEVKLTNLSSMEHTIHWHGMHQVGTWQSDGVPGITQQPIQPGGSFVYRFVATRVGTLWYHCHVNVPEHVGVRGMWGPLIVDPREPDPAAEEVTKEALLMFSGWNSEVADKFGVGGHPGETYDYFSINGRAFPTTQPLRVREGDVLRLRLFAVSIDVSFHLHGHDILVTHKDGLPLDSPFKADVLYIEHGARYDAIVHMDNPGLWINHDHIEHHVSNNGHAPGGAVMILEYEGVEQPDWYVWKDRPDYDPDFYMSESMTRGPGMFEVPVFRADEIERGRGR